MTTLGPMLLFRLRTIWKTVHGKFYPTRLITQTLPLLTTICSGRCRTPSLEYGSHQNRVSKIGLIHSWPPSRHSSFGMKSTYLIEKIHYDTKIIIPKYLPHFIKDDFELEGEVINIFKDAKYNSYLSSHPLNNTMTNLNTTFNIISIYNFWIQDYPEYQNDKKSRAIEWLNHIVGLFDKYLLYLKKLFELLIHAKNGLWHPECFDPLAFN